MHTLYSTNTSIDQDIFRNIVFIDPNDNPFDDLLAEQSPKKVTQFAIDAAARVKQNPSVIPQNTHYTTSIEYPFLSKPYQQSRFSNGEYGVWYGSIEHRTSVYETAYHMFRSVLAIEGINETVRQKRAIYTVYAKAILIDLRGKENDFPDLVADHYDLTHRIGMMLKTQGHPGLVAPSARIDGSNVVIFNPEVLSQPSLASVQEYALDPAQQQISVTNHVGKALMTIPFSHFKERLAI